MTLIVAIGCSDGVVIGADSASSDMDSGIKQPSEKIRRIGERNILFGGSGDVGLLQNINESLADFTQQPNLKRIRQQIKKRVVPELAEAVSSHSPYPQPGYNVPPCAILLFVGIQDGKPWILEIEKDGRDTIYDEGLGNFAAIGSGKPWAQALFRPHLKTERDIELGKIFAYRVIDDAITLAVGGLAPPIHIYTISSENQIEKVDQEELNKLSETCELWKSIEREAVGQALAEPKNEGIEPAIPEPQEVPEPQKE